jgi:U3 small nucleolar RNA-associated protein 3
VEDFGDEVADQVDMTRGSAGTAGTAAARSNALNDFFARQKVS